VYFESSIDSQFIIVRERERERERERSTIMKEYLILKCEHSDTKTLKNG
jgi:hypothetical protein